ncbi:helix-turn-helix domain-containing protein [Aliishimia ponticola]|uniref:helix-turn-helix domain-containing protein n=1 Tax=Aliishimia ponticola TaxID=2499833 RepID=UPI001B3B8F7D
MPAAPSLTVSFVNFSGTTGSACFGSGSEGLGATEIAQRLGVGRASVYRVLSE